MSKLSNVVVLKGYYNNIQTSLNSNEFLIEIPSDISISKSVDKLIWKDGILTYIITIDNKSNISYNNLIITDVINTRLVEFIPESIKINGVETDDKYIYDNDTHTLTFKLDQIDSNSTIIMSFSVKKNKNDFFVLTSNCKMYCNEEEYTSNYITVVSLIKKTYSLKNYECDVGHWRI